MKKKLKKNTQNSAIENISDDSDSQPAQIDESTEVEIGSELDFSDALQESLQAESFLPEADEAEEFDEADKVNVDAANVQGTELDAYESAEIEDLEFVEEENLESIIESILFASDRPVSLNSIKLVFKGTNIRTDKIKKTLDRLAVEYAGARRGVTLEEVPGGYQLRTKIDNMKFIARTVKARSFRLSGPALEVMAIVAYKQPLIKHEIDEIRGVESGHLLRALMEKGLVTFGEKSELPGKPMTYETTKKFLEIFSLRNLKELPTLSQIDELLPEGISEEEEAKPTLATITDSLAEQTIGTYSQGEEELHQITDQLSVITTSSEFFEQEKVRQKQKREAERAQSIREAIMVGETVSNRDKNWLSRFDEAQLLGQEIVEDEASKTEAAPLDSQENLATESQNEHDEDRNGDHGEHDEEDQLYSEESLEANDLADIEDDGKPEANL